jgi:hypothetical protein
MEFTQDIGTLDITMNNLPFMEIIQTLQDLPDKVADQRLFERAVIVEERRDRSTGYI